MPIKNTLEKKIQYRIKRSKDSVFIWSDFKDFCEDPDQIGRVFRKLIKNGLLIKIGYGLYAKAKKSTVTGKYIPVKDINTLAVEAMKKLKVKVVDSSPDVAYNRGETTQVPTGRVIGVRGRVSRKIGYNDRFIKYQRVTVC